MFIFMKHKTYIQRKAFIRMYIEYVSAVAAGCILWSILLCCATSFNKVSQVVVAMSTLAIVMLVIPIIIEYINMIKNILKYKDCY